MSASWHFEPFGPRDTLKDPIEAALFSQDSVENAAASVVREAIQNSLDAATSKGQMVTVRFAVRTGAKAAPASACAPFLQGAHEHLEGEGTGLTAPPGRSTAIPYLVVEDFGTKGLTGDTKQWRPGDTRANSFCLFFRALGRSGKKGEARGRWGVGKFVFPVASGGNCWFGLSIAVDTGSPLLMGRMVLKTHSVGNKDFQPDGTWGISEALDLPIQPVVGGDALAEHFVKTFFLKRRTEPGLSVVIPWLRSDVTGDAISRAVVREYFFPILKGELVVEVDDNGATTVLNAASVEAKARVLGDPTLHAIVELAVEAVTIPDEQITRLERADGQSAPEWEDALLKKELRPALLKRLDDGETVAFRVPFAVRPRENSARVTHFDVFLRQANGVGRVAPTLVRDGITISKAEVKQLQDYVALVVVDDSPLATMVGDAENPAHTQLQHQLLTEKYISPKPVLGLIREAPRGFVRALNSESDTNDPFLLAEFFPLESAEKRRPTPRGNPLSIDYPPPVIDPPPTQPPYRIGQLENGFSVTGTAANTTLDDIVVTCAYDVRSGSALGSFEPQDFRLDDDQTISIEDDGLHIIEVDANRLVARPLRADYKLSLTGFDRNRDLVVGVYTAGTEN